MGKTPVELIKEQIKYLPEKDIKFAEKFINNRNFEALQDLVNSDVYLVERDIKLKKREPKYSNINIEGLNSLKSTVDEYCNLLYQDIYDDYNDLENSTDDVEEEDDE